MRIITVGLVTIGVLLLPPLVSLSWKISQATLPHQLEGVCAVIRQKVPLLVDAHTRLDAISTTGHALIYEYTIIAMTDADAVRGKPIIADITAAQITANESQKILLDQGATFSFHYRNQAGHELFAIDVDATTPVNPALERLDPLDQALYAAWALISTRTPDALDQMTTLDSVSRQHHGLAYRYTISRLPDRTAVGLKDIAKASVLEQISGNAVGRKFLQLGATFTYNYVTTAGKPLFHYDVTKASLGGPDEDPLNRTVMFICMTVNNSTPRFETPTIRLDSAVPKFHGLTYCYTILTANATPIDRLAEDCKRTCTKVLHDSSALLLNDGATFSYVFRNEHGEVLFAYDVVK